MLSEWPLVDLVSCTAEIFTALVLAASRLIRRIRVPWPASALAVDGTCMRQVLRITAPYQLGVAVEEQ
jgi:hypothetical protein